MRGFARHVASLAMLLLAACGTTRVAPEYQPTATTTVLLQDRHAGKVNVGSFDSSADAAANPSQLAIHGNSWVRDKFVSPNNDSFADYVATALRVELSRAGCYDPHSPIVVAGTLRANHLRENPTAWGLHNQWQAGMTVRFVIRRDSQIVFDKTVTRDHEWESVGLRQFAVPQAIQEYGTMVQLLVRDLAGDPDFIAATR